MARSNGYVLYEGPSRIDGKPVVVILTIKTANAKTGPMAQTWVLRADVSPTQAINDGSDFSVCGDCSARGIIERLMVAGKATTTNRARFCYVAVRNAPRAVWRAYKAGRYPMATPDILKAVLGDKAARMGSYGDPTAAPLWVWKRLRKAAPGWTGYSHQWRSPANHAFRKLLMASVENLVDKMAANALGWRTFRIRRPGEGLEPDEVICPASAEAGYKRDCNACRACNGWKRPGQRSVAIYGHGSPSVMSMFLAAK